MTLSVFFSMYYFDTTSSQSQYPTNNTSVCINPDVTLVVFFSIYRSNTTRFQTQCPTNNTSVCINPDVTLAVFFSIYRSDTTRFRTYCSLHKKWNVSKLNKVKIHTQLIYILGFMVHVKNMDGRVCSELKL